MRAMKMFTKKGVWFSENWAEFFFFCLLTFGFLLSLSLESAGLSYTLILIFGFMCGRFLSIRKKGFPFYLIVFGFLVGFILGARFASWTVLLIFFFLAAGTSFYLHERGYLR